MKLSPEKMTMFGYAGGAGLLSLAALWANYGIVEHIKDHPEPLDIFGMEIEKGWFSGAAMGLAILSIVWYLRYLKAAKEEA